MITQLAPITTGPPSAAAASCTARWGQRRRPGGRKGTSAGAESSSAYRAPAERAAATPIPRTRPGDTPGGQAGQAWVEPGIRGCEHGGVELRPAYPVRSRRTALRPLSTDDIAALVAYRG